MQKTIEDAAEKSEHEETRKKLSSIEFLIV